MEPSPREERSVGRDQVTRSGVGAGKWWQGTEGPAASTWDLKFRDRTGRQQKGEKVRACAWCAMHVSFHVEVSLNRTKRFWVTKDWLIF